MAKINIGLLGMGTIGSGTYKVLEMNRKQIEKAAGASLEISKILEKDIDRDRGLVIDKTKFTQEPDDILKDPSISIIIELLGGIEPASTFMIKAMEAGKSVVTANKAAVAANYPAFLSAAEENGVFFKYEAAVGGGIPILNPLSNILLANEFEEILGIVNGTTNYILTKMADEDMSYGEALKLASQLGFAEADPRDDVEGIDAANKLTILAYLAFGKYLPPDKIACQGITQITKEDIAAAKARGNGIKLIAKALMAEGEVLLNVGPTELPLDHPLMGVKNEFNAIYLTGNAVGELMFYGKGAGALPTASAVLGDVIDIISRS